MYYLVLYSPLLAECFFKLGFNHGIISHFKEVNRDSNQDGYLIFLSAIKQPVTFCKKFLRKRRTKRGSYHGKQTWIWLYVTHYDQCTPRVSVTTTVLLTSSFRPWRNMVSHFQRVTVTMFWLTTRYLHCFKATHFVWAYARVKLWILHCLLWHLKCVEPKK